MGPDRLPGRHADRARKAVRYGRWTERLSLWLLWIRGWELVAWRQKVGRRELDLIVARGDELRVLEVKARRPGAWSGADVALSPAQRLRLQQALRSLMDVLPWPGRITFQRVSWSGWICRFHPPERWEAFNPAGTRPPIGDGDS